MKKYSCIWGIDPAIMGIETKTVSREHNFEKILNSGLENIQRRIFSRGLMALILRIFLAE